MDAEISDLEMFMFFLQEDLGLDADVYTKLQQALTEAENLKNEAYEESRRRQKTEKELVVVLQKVSVICIACFC